MKLVSDNSDSEIDRKRFEAEVSETLRDLTANLIRIARGAGKPYEIVRQVDALTKALIGYRDVVGYSSAELGNALMFDAWEEFQKLPSDYREIEFAKQEIVEGALQIAASRLIDQSLQEKAGDRQLFEGVRMLEKAREEHLKQWQAKRAAVRPQKGKPAKQTPKTEF